ncbi:hypothetical protein [Citreicoccus inhibens]|uniref:hypothetical protein n=1 Tax=Citreicoccus inhibens TaxID=2849499 RepID=UPI001EF06C57|nr:hypothetical protein [Citreicoccus inhibens]
MAADSSAPPKPADSSAPSPGPSPELQRLWFALERRPWSFLTVIPAHPGAPALDAAHALLEAGSPYPEPPLRLVDATGIEPAGAPRLVTEIRHRIAQGERIIVVIDSLMTHPASLPLALAADAALLCVTLGESDFGSAQKTLDLVGRERFVGSVTFPRAKKKRRAEPAPKPKP